MFDPPSSADTIPSTNLVISSSFGVWTFPKRIVRIVPPFLGVKFLRSQIFWLLFLIPFSSNVYINCLIDDHCIDEMINDRIIINILHWGK